MKRWTTRPWSRATRGVAAIIAGTGFGQVLAVLASPLLARLYTPADFGIFTVVNALAMVLGPAMALRYETAVPLPNDEKDARALFAVGTVVTFLATIGGTVAFWLLTPVVGDLIDEPRIEPWLVWVPPIAAILAVFRLLNQWALRQQRYTATARRNVISSVSTVTIQLVAGWRFAGASGLVAGLGVGQALGAASMLAGSRLRGSVRRADLMRQAARYRRFALLLAPAGVLNAAGIYLPVVLVTALYGTEAAGWLGFTQRILAAPLTLLGQAVAQVYLSELARTQRVGDGHHLRLFRTASVRLSLIGGIGAVVLLSTAKPLFPWVFGDEWTQSGAMAQALAVSLAVQLVAAPLSQTLVVFERVGLQFCWDLGRLLLVTATVVVTSAAGASLLGCVWALSVASALAYAVLWLLSRRTIVTHNQLASAVTT